MSTGLVDLTVFVRVADLQSFTGAGHALGLSTSSVSKRVRALEDRLGVRLLERTTRRMRLTEAGQLFRDRVAPLLDGLYEAEQAAACMRAEPRGVLRIAAPQAFGLRYLGAPLASFMAHWPELRVEVDYDDRTVDIIAQGYDVAVRGGTLRDEALVARRLVAFRGMLVASPAYLARHGTPQGPEDLVDHACLVHAGLRTVTAWSFAVDGVRRQIPVTGPLASGSGIALVQAAVAGLGICNEPEFLVVQALRSGQLVQILGRWETFEGAFWALYPHRRHLPAKVRLFVDHLVAAWAVPPWTQAGPP